MTPLQALPIAISLVSALIAITSLVITYRQKAKQDSLTARKSLTDTLSLIMATNTEANELSEKKSSFSKTERIRQINSQRRHLANHAELLISEIGPLSTDIDHNIIARAFTDVGDYNRAEAHWKKCIELSSAPTIEIFNMRGIANFYFNRGRFEEGRDAFEAALRIPLPDNDDARQIRADTLSMFAAAESRHGFIEEGLRRKTFAITEAKRIGNAAAQASAISVIEQHWDASTLKGERNAGQGE